MRCAFCHDGMRPPPVGTRSERLARLPHSHTRKVQFVPLCELTRRGVLAQRALGDAA